MQKLQEDAPGGESNHLTSVLSQSKQERFWSSIDTCIKSSTIVSMKSRVVLHARGVTSRRPRNAQWICRAFSNGRPRISETIQYDHQEIESHYYQILDSASEDSRTRFQNQFVWALARHIVGEELLLYPAFETFLEEGKVLADRGRREHQNVRCGSKSGSCMHRGSSH
ncbi:hypothetical protein VTO42DRAFT_8650 [Malbranchea cinnamomea]